MEIYLFWCHQIATIAIAACGFLVILIATAYLIFRAIDLWVQVFKLKKTLFIFLMHKDEFLKWKEDGDND